uniref:Vesicular, overexpressed in cancer, prosurvival protein 1 n=1 Tax=Clastoptera arizonana TaxID=38151 RepID=A0A1B6CPE9_9HEMI
MDSVFCLFFSLLSFTCVQSTPVNVCRATAFIRVYCPHDYHCCGNDECCKLTFGNENEQTTEEDVSNASQDFYQSEPVLILARLVIITILVSLGYFISRYIKCKAFTPDIRRYTLSNLPRYKNLDKNTMTARGVAGLVGSPYHETSTSTEGNRSGKMALFVMTGQS